jgi:hypothetical protein
MSLKAPTAVARIDKRGFNRLLHRRGKRSPAWRTAEAMGFIGPIEPELGALFHRVIGTLIRLVEPRH